MVWAEAGPEDGPPVLLVHGLGEHLGYWVSTIPALAEAGLRVLAPELPGFGRSERPSAPWSLSWQNDKIRALCARVCPGRVPLWVGHSMGGHLGLLAALDHPASVSGLVLLAPAGVERFTGAESRQLKAAASPQMYAAMTPELLSADYRNRLFGVFNGEAEARLRERIRFREAPDFMGYAQAVSWGVAAMLDEPVAGRLAREGVPGTLPVTVLLGGLDRLIPNPFLHPSMSQRDLVSEARRLLPGAEIITVPGVGHMLQLEDPITVNQAIIDAARVSA